MSIVYISHRLEELSRIGDVATVLRDGHNVGTVDLKNTDTDTLVRMMVGRSLTDMFPKESVPRGREALRVENLCGKGINGVSFTAYEGEILGFAGIVGCGRTELARAIFGADPISAGKVYVDGREVSILSPRQAIKAGIAYLTEDRGREGLVLGLAVRENIGLPVLDRVCRAGIVNSRRKSALAAGFVKDLDIKTPRLSTPARSLSGGNQQKIDMVLLMTVDPGFPGQRFVPGVVRKVEQVRRMIEQEGLDIDIEVDGGVNGETIPLLYRAGANVFVAGTSSVFNGLEDTETGMRKFKAFCEGLEKTEET